MGGTLVIRDNESSWMPSSSAFYSVFEHIALKLRPANPSLATEIEERLEWLPYLDWSNLDAHPFNQVLSILQNTVVQAFQVWGAEPEIKDSLWSICVLKALLLLDSRSEMLKSATRTIRLSSDTTWSAPEWMYDFVLENMITRVFRKGSKELAQMLLPCLSDTSMECDLSEVTAPEFQTLLVELKSMHGRYHELSGGYGMAIYTPAFLVPFVPKIIALYEAACADDRANGLCDDDEWFIDQMMS